MKRYAYGDFGMDLLDDGEFVLHSDYAALLARHNALVEAVKRMMAADSPGVWNAKDYMESRAELDRLLEGK